MSAAARDDGDTEWLTSRRVAERTARLGSALSRMAQDLAASNRENRRLRGENAALRHEIERLERRCAE